MFVIIKDVKLQNIRHFISICIVRDVLYFNNSSKNC